MVLSTIHTNSAPGTVQRLINMGVEPFLLASAMKMIISQRL
ncbi:Flp pilus assembly complex ATPase component [bacterium]|nr:Flp pilus assembly complex ATPase component [bacterium]